MNPPFDPDTEQRFVARVLAGSPRQQQQFDQRLACVPRMLAHRNRAMGLPLGSDELQDVAQETFLVILRRLPSYRPVRPLESWIYGICALELRHAVRSKRRLQRRVELFAEDAPEPVEPGRGVADAVTDYADAIAALDRLGGVEADVLALKCLEGLTFAEVGARLGMPANTAKTHYHRGIRRLRRLLCVADAGVER